MLGSAVLVVPVTVPGATSQNVFLPGSQPWFDLEDGTRYEPVGLTTVNAPANKIPVFQR
jgi:alpha-glucosidase (family GH31 glycosyl hydrolase)